MEEILIGCNTYALDDIVYIRANHIYVDIHLKSGEVCLERCPISHIAVNYEETSLVQVHRSYIVNRDKIDSFHSMYLKMENISEHIPVGRCYKEHLQTVSDYLAYQ